MARNPLTGAADHSPAFDDGARWTQGGRRPAATPSGAARSSWPALDGPEHAPGAPKGAETPVADRAGDAATVVVVAVSGRVPVAIRGTHGAPLDPGIRPRLNHPQNRSRKLARGLPPPGPPQGAKRPGFKTQSNVLATRKPKSLKRSPAEYQMRDAERTFLGSKLHEPPRNTRRKQSPEVHALPSDGAPA